MADSGYQHPVRKEVIKSAVTKYYRQVLVQETGGRKLYRSAEEMAESRRLKTLLNRTWFKSRRGGQSLMLKKDLTYSVQRVDLETRRTKPRKEKEEEPCQTDRKVGGQGQATPPLTKKGRQPR